MPLGLFATQQFGRTAKWTLKQVQGDGFGGFE